MRAPRGVSAVRSLHRNKLLTTDVNRDAVFIRKFIEFYIEY